MRLLIVALLTLFPSFVLADIHHDLNLVLYPQKGEIAVIDTMTLEEGGKSQEFVLASSLVPEVEGGQLRLLERGEDVKRYRVDAEGREVAIRYRGSLPPGGGDIFGMPRAVVSEQGVALDGSSAWYPVTESETLTYRLTVEVPQGWQVIGQDLATRDEQGRFVLVNDYGQEDILLVAGPFVAYQQKYADLLMQVYLTETDDGLAERYLAVMGSYVDFYQELLGEYPYQRFAVVENRWQTGYGMPSFTLLGSRVIRLPFLLHSSLPHEILHNWLGNGVFTDSSRGNWSEGLTAYLADHLIQEAQGKGASHRQRALARYTDFATDGRDFSLEQFRARHSDTSQAVGYDKSLMLFHMLRQELGDARFVAGLRRFYGGRRFKRADFDDLLRNFADDGLDTAAFYRQWIERAGAPELALAEASARESEGGFRLKLVVEQTQKGAPFRFEVPVYVTLQGDAVAQRQLAMLDDRLTEIELAFDRRPLRVDIDPEFDVFRQLSPLERPAALGRLFGNKRQWLVIPSAASEDEQQAWQQLAAAWAERYDNVQVVLDSDLQNLPEQDTVWLLGWSNGLLDVSRDRFAGASQQLLDDRVHIGGRDYAATEHAVVLLDPDNSHSPLGFIGASDPVAIARLARKLTHYGSFGRLVFQLPGVNNRVRDRLPVVSRPLSKELVEKAPTLRVDTQSPLAKQVKTKLPL